MQVTKEKMAAQQLVLFHLGFYKGNIDGIWSSTTIAAKRMFEADPSFLPAYPNNGLPFGERDKLPKGWRYGAKGIIGHSSLTPERTKEILDDHAARLKAADQRNALKAGVAPAQPVVEVEAEGADTQAAEVVSEPVKTDPASGNQQQRHDHQRHKGNR